MFAKLLTTILPCALCSGAMAAGDLEKNFVNPPDSARPGVYWYFMDGNLNGKEMIETSQGGSLHLHHEGSL